MNGTLLNLDKLESISDVPAKPQPILYKLKF